MATNTTTNPPSGEDKPKRGRRAASPPVEVSADVSIVPQQPKVSIGDIVLYHGKDYAHDRNFVVPLIVTYVYNDGVTCDGVAYTAAPVGGLRVGGTVVYGLDYKRGENHWVEK